MASIDEMAVPVILFAATVCFALGLVLPVAVFETLLVFTERPSLLEVIDGLWARWRRAPSPSWSGCFRSSSRRRSCSSSTSPPMRRERLHWVERVGVLSKWSMADVLVVALAIFAAKTSGLAEAATQSGIWFYAAATLLSAAAAVILTRRARSQPS